MPENICHFAQRKCSPKDRMCSLWRDSNGSPLDRICMCLRKNLSNKFMGSRSNICQCL